MHRIFSEVRFRTLKVLLALLFIITSLFINITATITLFSLVLIYQTLPLPRSINSVSMRMVSTVIAQLSIFNVLGLLFYVSRYQASMVQYCMLSLVIVGLTYAALLSANKLPRLNRLSKLDFVIFLPVVAGVGIFLAYLFFNSLSFSENLIRFMGSSSDQAAHLSMFGDVIRNNGNYPYYSNELSINTPGINSYPLGWHQSMGILTYTLTGGHLSSGPFINMVTAYFMAAMLTLAIYISAISIMTTYLYRDNILKGALKDVNRAKAPNIRSALFVTMPTIATILSLFLYVSFSGLGYINYIYVVSTAIVVIIILGSLRKNRDITPSILFTFSLLTTVSMETWYIMAIPLGGVFVYLTYMYWSRVLKKTIDFRFTLLVIGLYIVPALSLFSAMRRVLSDGPAGQLIIGNALAGWMPSVIVSMAVIVSAIILLNKQKETLTHLFYNSLLVSLALLTMWNVLHLQEYSYYQQKMHFALFALCIPVSLVALMDYIKNTKQNAIIILVLVFSMAYYVNPGGIIYLIRYTLRPQTDQEIPLIDKYFASNFDDRNNVVFIEDIRTGPENSTESYTRLALSKVASRNDCYNQIAMSLITFKNTSLSDRVYKKEQFKGYAHKCYGNNVRFIVLSDAGVSEQQQ